MLRWHSDWRTILWAFVCFPAVGFAPYIAPWLIPWLVPLTLYFGFCAGVLSHNQNHCPTFKGRGLNAFYGAWLSVFYGCPMFPWIPTHNLNHHRYINAPGDATITWRYSKKNTWFHASTYYFISAYWQWAPVSEYVRKARDSRPALYRRIVFESAVTIGAHAGLLVLSIWLRGWNSGLIVYGFGFLVPALFAAWSVIFLNYLQHVHTDPWSRYNHSRNFVSKFGNWLAFNNGYHTVHHERPGLHWSKLPEAHAQIRDLIDAELNQKTLIGFCLKTYVLGAISKTFRTKQIGRAPDDPSGHCGLELDGASTAGINASAPQ